MISDPHPDLLPPVRSSDFLPPISRWATLGGLFLIGAFGAVITLAAVTRYNVAVKATATIRPSGELKIVQSAIDGTIKTIQVSENQVVKRGQPIATVDDLRLQTQKSQLQGNIRQNQLQLGQIDAQIDALRRQIAAETQLSDRSIASAQADLTRTQREYQERQITTRADVAEAEATLRFARSELEKYQAAAAQGAIAQIQVVQKQGAVEAAEAKLQRVQASLNPTSASVSIAQERIAQEHAKGQSTIETLQKEHEALLQRRIEVQTQIKKDQNDLQQIDGELNKNVIRASSDGTILKLDLRNPGQTVRSGDSVAQIAPSQAPLLIKAQVGAQDIGNVKVGQKVQMRVSAYPYPDYGTLQGKVVALPPDATAPQTNATPNAERNSAGISPYYEVTIRPDKLYLKDNPKNQIRLGMNGSAEIISSEETVLKFVLRKARLLTNL